MSIAITVIVSFLIGGALGYLLRAVVGDVPADKLTIELAAARQRVDSLERKVTTLMGRNEILASRPLAPEEGGR